MKDKTQLVIRYHERTKHHPNRYARSPGFLDWANEPDPFRRYEGATLLPLPLGEEDPDGDYHKLYERGNRPFRPFSLTNISTFLKLSLGLSAWKSFHGARWALRMNPSSGNLHPTEAYVILSPLPESNHRAGVYHYNPFFHALELRADFDEGLWLRIRDHFSTDGFLIGLSSIYWRESWKYGERAFRYCNQDIGHAMAALSFSGNLLGWKISYLNALSDQDVGALLGFPKTNWRRFEEEYPEILLFVHAYSEMNIPGDIPPEIIDSFRAFSYFGEPNPLSNSHRDWEVIGEVSSAAEKPRSSVMRHRYREYPFSEEQMPPKQAASIIRQRRSALAFDAKTALPKEYFLGMLDKTLPRDNAAPFDLGLGETSVHLLIFVHRVSGLDPGLYFFVREERYLEEIKLRCRTDFRWEKIDTISGSVGLYLLNKGDFRNEGAKAGCNQEIAGDGAFSLAMISLFRENLERLPFHYRRLHWEAERQLAIEPHIPERFRLAIRTLQSTGMRPGELRALQVSDMIDGALKVWKAFGDHGLRLSRKSGGEVTYPVPLDLWRSLQAHTEGKKADDLIFSTKDGKPLYENTLFKVWKRACKNAGVKYIPLYQASRHSMASQIMADHKKKAIEEIQAKLGHSDKHTQKAYVVEG